MPLFNLHPTEIEEDFKHPHMIHPSSRKTMELDVYIEELKLAVEYQGQQHYKPVYGMNADFELQQTRDKEKREACKQVNSIYCI